MGIRPPRQTGYYAPLLESKNTTNGDNILGPAKGN